MSDLGGYISPLLFLGCYELIYLGWVGFSVIFSQGITPLHAVSALRANAYTIIYFDPFDFSLNGPDLQDLPE